MTTNNKGRGLRGWLTAETKSKFVFFGPKHKKLRGDATVKKYICLKTKKSMSQSVPSCIGQGQHGIGEAYDSENPRTLVNFIFVLELAEN